MTGARAISDSLVCGVFCLYLAGMCGNVHVVLHVVFCVYLYVGVGWSTNVHRAG